jgi:hypothetical protein
VEEFQNEEEVENARSSINKCDLNHEVCRGSIMSVKKFTEIIQRDNIIFGQLEEVIAESFVRNILNAGFAQKFLSAIDVLIRYETFGKIIQKVDHSNFWMQSFEE